MNEMLSSWCHLPGPVVLWSWCFICNCFICTTATTGAVGFKKYSQLSYIYLLWNISNKFEHWRGKQTRSGIENVFKFPRLPRGTLSSDGNISIPMSPRKIRKYDFVHISTFHKFIENTIIVEIIIYSISQIKYCLTSKKLKCTYFPHFIFPWNNQVSNCYSY